MNLIIWLAIPAIVFLICCLALVLKREGKTMQDFSYGVVPMRRLKDNYEVLLIKHIAGYWSFPKGHMETGEDEILAAKRELSEETGINKVKIFAGPTFSEHYIFKQNRQTIDKTVKYFIGLVEQNEVNIDNREVTDYSWVSLGEAKQKLTFPEGKRILKEVGEYLEAGM